MKRIFFAILIMFMLLPSTTFATQMSSNELLNLAFVTPTDGNNWNNYIRVSTASDLKRISNDLSANYYLANDIIFTDADFKKGGLFYNNGAGWTGFGTSDVPLLGIFDGNNHKISGICFNIQSSDNAYCGMFRYNKGTIKI